MIGVEPPRRARPSVRAMRAENARGFFAWLPTSSWARWHPIFLFALATAARRGEVLALRRENIDLTRGVANRRIACEVTWIDLQKGHEDGAYPRSAAVAACSRGAAACRRAKKARSTACAGGL